MFVIWNVRASPRRQSACGGSPVMSCAGEADVPGVAGEVAGDEVEQRGLARAVGADDRRAGRRRGTAEVDATDGVDAAEVLARGAVGLED